MKQAMIFAAGLGTRLRPLTDCIPKALVRVGEEPLLYHVIMKLQRAGFERIVVNVHHFARQIINYLLENDNFGLDIRISDESDGLLETGGGIKKALSLFDSSSPVLIHNVDILSNADLNALYEKALIPNSDGVLLVSQRDTRRYFIFDQYSRLKGWTNVFTKEVRPQSMETDFKENDNAYKLLAFSGIHVLSPSSYPLFAGEAERFGIVDFYMHHCDSHHFTGVEQEGLQLLDVGKLESLERAEMFLHHHS